MESSNDSYVMPVSGGEISYVEAGEGPAIVWLHGIGSGAGSWRHQKSHFSSRFRVVMWNAPGYGQSTPPTNEFPSAGDYAVSLVALLDSLQIRRCHLVGHSLGALMAARFAADYGDERLLSLTLCAAAGGKGRLSALQQTAILDERLGDLRSLGARGMAEKRGPRLLGPGATADMIQEVIEIQANSVKAVGYERAARMLVRADIYSDLKRLPASLRVQVVYGEDDSITLPESSQSIAAACGAPAYAVVGAGHALYLERPERFNEVIETLVHVVADRRGVPADPNMQ